MFRLKTLSTKNALLVFALRAFVFLVLLLIFSQNAFAITRKAYNFFVRINMMMNDESLPYAVKEYCAKMTRQEKIAQLFLLNLQGDTEFSSKTEYNSGIAPGGYLLFSYNIGKDATQIRHFTDSVRDWYVKKNQTPPYLAIDHEGGSVNRLRNVYGTFPSEQTVAARYLPQDAYALYFSQGKILKTLGINVNLSPIVEEKNDDNSVFLENRSFGSLEQVILYGTECVNAYLDSGIIPVLKHFPGNTNDDPHIGLPKLNVNRIEFEKMILPFQNILQKLRFSRKNCGVLISHAMLPNLYGNLPACFSKKIVIDILKEQNHFSGLVFSDDIYMAALEKNGYSPNLSAKLCIKAGIDVVMMSTKRFTPILDYLMLEEKVDSELRAQIDESSEKIIATKLKMGLFSMEKIENPYANAFEKMGFPKLQNYVLVNP